MNGILTGNQGCPAPDRLNESETPAKATSTTVFDRSVIDRLKKSEALAQAILDTAAEGIITTDEHGLIESFNASATRIFGYAPKEIIGRNVSMLMPSAVRNNYDGDPTPYLRTDETDAKRLGKYFTGRRKNGTTLPLHLAVSEVTVDGRRMFTGVVVDMTEKNRAEQELRLKKEALRHSNEELKQFAYVVSHDLQAPLRKILTFGDRLKSVCGDGLPDDGRDYLGRMQGAAQRMQQLIGDLLNLASVTTQPHPFKRINLSLIVRDVVKDLEVDRAEVGGQIKLGRLPTLNADPTQMRQLFQNLIGNSLKYRRQNVPPTIRVHDQPIDGGLSGWCRLVFEDNGIGFEEKNRDRIFRVFERLHGVGQYHGSGVGLAICKKIVERHGGIITAHSTAGEGSTFLVFLPLSGGEKERLNPPPSWLTRDTSKQNSPASQTYARFRQAEC